MPEVAIMILQSEVYEADIIKSLPVEKVRIRSKDIDFGTLCFVLQGKVSKAYEYLARIHGKLLHNSPSLLRLADYCIYNGEVNQIFSLRWKNHEDKSSIQAYFRKELGEEYTEIEELM